MVPVPGLFLRRGSPLNEEILGIRDDLPARITPHSGGVVRWCHGHVTTPRGRIEVAWNWKPDCYELEVTLPAGLTAEVAFARRGGGGCARGERPKLGRHHHATGHKIIHIEPGKIR